MIHKDVLQFIYINNEGERLFKSAITGQLAQYPMFI